MSNYLISIDTGIAATDSTIGLTNGVYEWAIGDEHDKYVTDVMTDKGVSNLKRSIDQRTGGGNSQDTRVGVELMGGKYTTIQSNADIVGKRIRISEITWDVQAAGYVIEVRYVGVITSVDVIGYKSIVNIYLESRNRAVDLPYSSGAIGDVVIDGTVEGTKTYFKLNGYNVVVQGESSSFGATQSVLYIEGSTTQNVANIDTLLAEMIAASIENNIYYEGIAGIYKVENVSTGGSGRILLQLGVYDYYGDVSQEVGAVGTTFYSSEVYNFGIGGGLVVEVDNNQIEIDDVNSNIIDYNGGSIIDAGDGIVWKSLTNSTVSGDYALLNDTIGANKALPVIYNHAVVDGVGVYYKDTVPTSVDTIGTMSNMTDKEFSTFYGITHRFSPSASLGVLGDGFIFSMNGYRFTADKLYLAVYYDNVVGNNMPTKLEIGVTSYIGVSTTTPEQELFFRATGSTDGSTANAIYNAIPSTYATAVTDESVFDFYHPTAIGIQEDGTEGLLLDITACIPELDDGVKYYDDLRIYVALVTDTTTRTQVTGSLSTINHLNLIEGYNVGREGLSDNQVHIDNSAINGTIPLAYTDCIKRQNLFGINSTPPADGWGTEQVQADGNGNLLSDDYIMQNIPTGDLEGSLGAVSTTKLKSEIAKSVPATSAYDKDGVEVLIPIGEFSDNSNTISYSDIAGDINMKAYEGRDIQPSLQFTFGTDKKRLQINNVEASAYSSTYVVDEVGLTDQQRENLWDAGHALYEAYGLNTSQTVKNYPIVNDAEGADRIATALYANMGYTFGRVFPRMVATFNTKKSVSYDIGVDVTIDTPQLTAIGKVTSFTEGVYGGTNAYVCDVIDTVIPTDVDEILQTGAQTDDVLQTGTETDDILQQGLL